MDGSASRLEPRARSIGRVKTVFVTRRLPIDVAALAPPDVQVLVDDRERPLTADEIAAAAGDADALLPQLTETIDRELLARLPRLRVVANYAVGVNNVDLAAARERGVVVCNTPDVLTDATADLTLTLLLTLARRVREGERIVRSGSFGGWGPSFLLGRDLAGKTIGLFGFGRIAKAVARRAAAFGMRVRYTSRTDHGASLGERVPFETLLADSDVVSLHAPLAPETHHVVDARALAAMRPGALLINTARGPLVDEAALARALEAGHLGGAGLDVFEHEPAVHPALLGRDDVVLLPHVGSATRETRQAMAQLALENCLAVLAGKAPRTPVT